MITHHRLCWILLLSWPLAAQASAIDASASGLPEAKPIKRVAPYYPTKAIEREIAGDTEVKVEVLADGDAGDVVLLKETPSGLGFGDSAIRAVRKWEFEPGKPGIYSVVVKFRLHSATRVDLSGVTLPPAPPPTAFQPPIYPPVAYELRQEGRVAIAVEVDDHGHVDKAAVVDDGVVNGDAALFGDPAHKAVIDWEFSGAARGLYLVEIAFTFAELTAGRLVVHPFSRQ